jgi:hypothetical protein
VETVAAKAERAEATTAMGVAKSQVLICVGSIKCSIKMPIVLTNAGLLN